MKNKQAIQLPYKTLVRNLKKEITQGMLRARNAYNKEKILTYWKIGETIHSHFIQNRVQAEFGKMIFLNLSRDLEIGEQLLYQIVQFYKAYPHFKPKDNVTWSHYRRLASITDKRARRKFEMKVSKERLPNKAFDILVQEYKQALNSGKPLKLEPVKKLRGKKGKFYTYKLIKNNHSKRVAVDLGFRISRDTNKTSFKTGFVQGIKKGKDFEIKSIEAKRKDLYTFIAYVNHIVDGDTIWFDIDLGFNTWFKHKVRINGIEAPEIDTKEGQKAKAFLENTLKHSHFVILKSHGRDKFGRYLMDIYYKNNELNPNIVLEKGNYLNQELMNSRLVWEYGK